MIKDIKYRPLRKAPTVYEQAWEYHIITVGTIYQNVHYDKLFTAYYKKGQLVSSHIVTVCLLTV